ncbi:MAG: hypothetical protein J7K72_01415 [Candidatus Aenigmarchaeota archaeon]|nr:hypothetical protein [Candidatus Aenigmarchaeota archaeon]
MGYSNKGFGMTESEKIKEVEKSIFNTFTEITKTMGFSPIHGNIIAALFVYDKMLSLKDLARKTGYSTSMISISLDFLELLGIIKKVKKPTDRKLYIRLNGDLLFTLKNIFLMRISKSIGDSLNDLQRYKKILSRLKGKEKADVLKAVVSLEAQIKRLDTYLKILSDIEMP